MNIITISALPNGEGPKAQGERVGQDYVDPLTGLTRAHVMVGGTRITGYLIETFRRAKK